MMTGRAAKITDPSSHTAPCRRLSCFFAMNPYAPHSAPSPVTGEGVSLPKVTTRAGASAGVTDPESSGLSTPSLSSQLRWTPLG